MKDMKLPVTVIGVVILQIGGFIFWIGQQASTISDLEETVSQLGSRMAIEDNVNLRRDVSENTNELNDIWKDVDDLWDEMDGLMMSIGAINNIKQRIAVIENDMKYIHRDHNNMQDPRSDMH